MTLLECHKSREEGKEGERKEKREKGRERGRENERERERREGGGGERLTHTRVHNEKERKKEE